MIEYEEKIIEKARNGNSDAFGTLVSQYEKMVYNTVYYHIGNRDESFDLSQEVFIKAYRSISSFRGDCKFSTWLYKICQNTCRDYIRSKSKRSHLSLSDYSDDNTYEGQHTVQNNDVDSIPEESYDKNEKRRLVREAILNLKPEAREIIILRDINGLTYDEISEKMGLELGTVKSRLSRARQEIKKYLIERNCF